MSQKFFQKLQKITAQMVATLMIFSFSFNALAATITVNTLNDTGAAGDCELRDAIGSANTNTAVDNCVAGEAAPVTDIIDFSVSGTVNLNGTQLPAITETLEIDGDNDNDNVPDITIDAAANSRILEIDSPDVTVRGFSFLNGASAGDTGGSIRVNTGAELTLRDSSFDNAGVGLGVTANGGAIGSEVDAGLIDLDNVDFNNTSAGAGGAIYLGDETVNVDPEDDDLVINNSTFSNNSSTATHGGAIYIGDNNEVTIQNTTIDASQAARKGGAVYHAGETTPPPTNNLNLNATNLSITNSIANDLGLGDEGGGLYIGTNAETAASGLVIDNASAYQGGGVFISPAGILDLGVGSSITNSTAEFGGGFYMSNATDLTMLGELVNPIIVDNNTAVTAGGGVYINNFGANLNLTYVNITNNDALESGGGIRVGTGDTLTAFSSVISGNTAYDGGGIYSTDDYGIGENKPIDLSYVQMDGNIATNDGGAIFAGNRTDLELDNVTSLTTANQATGSGGFLLLGSSGPDSSLYANNITISSNSANSCGAMTIGGAYTPATPALEIVDSTFSNNSATTFGGGVCLNFGALLIDNTQFINNTAGVNGGGLFLNDNGSDSQTTLRNFSFFSSNTATGSNGGDIFVSQNVNNNELIIENGVFNTSSTTPMSMGGSIFNQQGTVDISDSSFTGNRLMSVDYGGAIFNDAGSLTIDGSSFNTYLTNFDGAAINSQVGNVTISNTTFGSAEAVGNGGAIRSSDNTLNISGSTFDFSLANNGGAIYDVDSIINIDNSSFTNGDAASGGGAIYIVGGGTDLNVTKSYFGQNEAGYGGAFYINEGDLSLINSTVDNNDAIGGDGGGLYLSLAAGVIDIFSSTIVNNHALAFGGGLRNSTGTSINLGNTILADNTNTIGAFAGPDCASGGQLSLFGYNLIGNSTGCGGVFDPNDLVDTAAGLGTLALHGGTTLNYDLLSTSAAIDSGDSSEIDDQRGTARPQYSGDDIGAHEFVDLTAPVITEVTPVPSPDVDTTPDYTFSSTEAGTITYGGGCSSVTTNAVVGPLTITFNTLTPGTYSLCTITVTDLFTNVSNILTISSFTINAPVIPPSSGGGGSSSSGSGGGSASFGQPASSGGQPVISNPTNNNTTTNGNNNQPPNNNSSSNSNNSSANTNNTGSNSSSSSNSSGNPPASNTGSSSGSPSSNSTSQSNSSQTTLSTPADSTTPPADNSTANDTTDNSSQNQSQNLAITPGNTDLNFGTPENYQQFSLNQNSSLCNAAVFEGKFRLPPGLAMDSDGDGLSDALECQVNTDPTISDTDRDGKSDGEEVLSQFTNPNSPDSFDPAAIQGEFVVVTLPEDSLITGDDSPLFLGLARPQRLVDVYVFDSTDFDDYRQQLQNRIQADSSLSNIEKQLAYDREFNLTVATILSKFIQGTLDRTNPLESRFIDNIYDAGNSNTDQKGVFALDSATSLVDGRYLVMGKSGKSYSIPVEFTLDSSLAFITPEAQKLDGQTITEEVLSGQISLVLTPGNSKPALTGKVSVPSRIVALWQSNITSSALLADSLDQEFRLTPSGSLEPGDHTVMLTAYRNGDNAQSKTLKIKFNIPAKMPVPDFIWWPYVLVAIILIGLGTVYIVRRKQLAAYYESEGIEIVPTKVSAPASPSSRMIDTQTSTSNDLPHPFASIPPVDQQSIINHSPEKNDSDQKKDPSA
jgi:hypothetical protein